MRSYHPISSSDDRFDLFKAKDRVVALVKNRLRIAILDYVQPDAYFNNNVENPPNVELPNVRTLEALAITWKRNRINYYKKADGKWEPLTHILIDSYSAENQLSPNTFHQFAQIVMSHAIELAKDNGYRIPIEMPSYAYHVASCRAISYSTLLLCLPVVREFWRTGLMLENLCTMGPGFNILRLLNFKTAVRKSFGHSSRHLLRLIGPKMVRPSEMAKYTESRPQTKPGERQLRNGGQPFHVFREGVKRSAGPNSVTFEASPNEYLFEHTWFYLGLTVRNLLDINRIHHLVESSEGFSEMSGEELFRVRRFLQLFPEPRRMKLLGNKRLSDLADSARMWNQYEDRLVIPNDWKNLKELHDQLVVQYNQILQEEALKKNEEQDKMIFEIPDDIKTIDGATVEDVTIVLATNAKLLRAWGVVMRNCIGSYFERASTGECYLLGVYRDGKVVYNLEITAKRQLAQFVGFANSFDVPEQDRDCIIGFLTRAGVIASNERVEGGIPGIDGMPQVL